MPASSDGGVKPPLGGPVASTSVGGGGGGGTTAVAAAVAAAPSTPSTPPTRQERLPRLLTPSGSLALARSALLAPPARHRGALIAVPLDLPASPAPGPDGDAEQDLECAASPSTLSALGLVSGSLVHLAAAGGDGDPPPAPPLGVWRLARVWARPGVAAPGGAPDRDGSGVGDLAVALSPALAWSLRPGMHLEWIAAASTTRPGGSRGRGGGETGPGPRVCLRRVLSTGRDGGAVSAPLAAPPEESGVGGKVRGSSARRSAGGGSSLATARDAAGADAFAGAVPSSPLRMRRGTVAAAAADDDDGSHSAEEERGQWSVWPAERAESASASASALAVAPLPPPPHPHPPAGAAVRSWRPALAGLPRATEVRLEWIREARPPGGARLQGGRGTGARGGGGPPGDRGGWAAAALRAHFVRPRPVAEGDVIGVWGRPGGAAAAARAARPWLGEGRPPASGDVWEPLERGAATEGCGGIGGGAGGAGWSFAAYRVTVVVVEGAAGPSPGARGSPSTTPWSASMQAVARGDDPTRLEIVPPRRDEGGGGGAGAGGGGGGGHLQPLGLRAWSAPPALTAASREAGAPPPRWPPPPAPALLGWTVGASLDGDGPSVRLAPDPGGSGGGPAWGGWRRLLPALCAAGHPATQGAAVRPSFLVTGAAGSGRSRLARAAAAACGFNYVEIRVASLCPAGALTPAAQAEVLVAALDAARGMAPCVLCLRGVDALAAPPGAGGGAGDAHHAAPAGAAGAAAPAVVRALARLTGATTRGTFDGEGGGGGGDDDDSAAARDPARRVVVVGTTARAADLPSDLGLCFSEVVRAGAPPRGGLEAALEAALAGAGAVPEPGVAAVLAEAAAGAPRREALAVASDALGRACSRADVDANVIGSEGQRGWAEPAAWDDASPAAAPRQIVVSAADAAAAAAAVAKRARTEFGAARVPTVRWEDVGGLEDAKREIRDAVELPLRRPDLFRGARARRSGVLLYGELGRGCGGGAPRPRTADCLLLHPDVAPRRPLRPPAASAWRPPAPRDPPASPSRPRASSRARSSAGFRSWRGSRAARTASRTRRRPRGG